MRHKVGAVHGVKTERGSSTIRVLMKVKVRIKLSFGLQSQKQSLKNELNTSSLELAPGNT
jgi:hypothetical protein